MEGCSTLAHVTGRSKQGFKTWSKYCRRHRLERYNQPNRSWQVRRYRKHKKDHCEKCGFIPEHRCQLDVDHIDGNHKNNELSNLQTLCANCHRLKTYLNEDYLPKAK